MAIILDACAIMAVLMEEPEKDAIIKLTQGSIVIVPNVIDFEIANALSKLYRRKILSENDVYETYFTYKKMPLQIKTVNINSSIGIFCKFSMYAYDSYYLEIASRLNLPLLTFDLNMKKAANDMNIKVLEV
jgi:predicted nucleic acid-binding protein